MLSPSFAFPLLFLLLFIFPSSSSSSSSTHSLHDDGQSLLAFKKLITSDPNNSMANWTSALPFCNWTAVSCSRRHTNRVVALDLSDMDLRGTISPSLGNLSFLRSLNLSQNGLYGHIPPQLGRLFRLRWLWLFSNELEGNIPHQLSGCRHLVSLDLSFSNLSGNIPGELGSLPHLQELYLGANSLTGNLLKNGDFEEGPLIFRNSSSGVLLPPNTDDDNSPLPGWIMESMKAVKYIDAFHYAIPQGRRAVELLAGKESAIVQMVMTEAGKAYVPSFLVGDGSNKCNGSMIVEAFAGRATIQVPYESQGTGGFKMANLTFTATSARSRIAFFSTYYHMRSDDFSSLCGPVIDDVKLFSLHANSAILSSKYLLCLQLIVLLLLLVTSLV